jgi:hypothetical protein
MTGPICRGDPSRSAWTAENGATSAPKLIGRSRQTEFARSAYTDPGPGNAAVTTPSSPLVEFPGAGPLEGLCLAFRSTLVPPQLWMHAVLIRAPPLRIRLAAEVAAAATVLITADRAVLVQQ